MLLILLWSRGWPGWLLLTPVHFLFYYITLISCPPQAYVFGFFLTSGALELEASSSGLLNKIQKYVPKSVYAVDGRSCCLRVRFIIASCCRRTHVRQQWKCWRRVQLLISISGVQAHNYFHGKLPGTPPKIRPFLNFCENCAWGQSFL